MSKSNAVAMEKDGESGCGKEDLKTALGSAHCYRIEQRERKGPPLDRIGSMTPCP